jgi:integrase
MVYCASDESRYAELALELPIRPINELIASFVNCSNLLKSWEKTETCEGSASGAYGPKNAAITRIPAPYAATESHHFSDRTAPRMTLLPYTLAHARRFGVTENSQPVLWLTSLQVLPKDPTTPLANARIQSPLPDYLYEQEVKSLYHEASKDPRLYLVVLVFLETGMKSSELSSLTTAHVDISDPYRPELWIKHSGKQTKKDRNVALPPQFVEVYQRYLAQYRIEDALFPYTRSSSFFRLTSPVYCA